jgi:hypothetical protein
LGDTQKKKKTASPLPFAHVSVSVVVANVFGAIVDVPSLAEKDERVACAM